MPAVTVRACWNAMNAWSRARAASEVQSFTKRQPIVSGCVLAYLEDDGQVAVGVGLQIALAVDGYYTRALGHPPSRVKPRVMDKALDDAEHALERLVGVEPALALRRSLFERDMAAPEVVVELIELIMAEAEGDPALRPAAGAIFIAAKAVALAYERTNRLESPKSSLGAAIEAKIGGPLPRIGRNDPCPCGSGRKFKKCCATAEPPPLPMLGDSRAEQLFADYMHLLEGVSIFFNVVCHEQDGRWLRRQDKTFEKQFRPGKDGGVPDSLHTSWLLFDLRLPSSGKTVGELFLERHGPSLLEPGPTHLRHLCASYPAFYEVVELLSDRGQKRVRELVTGVEWMVSDVEDPEAREGAPGDVWLCRLVGPREDAVTFMTPLVYPPAARDGLAKMTAFLLGTTPAGQAPLALKRASWFLAEYLVAAQKPQLSFPRLANTDGDPLLATTLVYEIDSVAAAFDALADLAGPDGPDDVQRAEDGSVTRATIRWVEERSEGPLENVLVAMLRLEPGRLAVEVNSRKRATAARRLIKQRLGGAAHLEETRQEPFAEAMKKALADPEWPEKARAADERQAILLAEHPELRRALEEHVSGYYRRWLDMALPALGGKTPRAAVETRAGRERVRELLDDLERMDARRPAHVPAVDVRWLRRELGLEE